ncbi:MAG: AAA family ATPase [Verrucomicrobiaceae bacterium]|nr:MAG: AAA family ATPase [Verrucomicrobiaceae bacterium]
MQRVLVLGCSGAGKTTLTLAIGQKLGLPVIHLDAHYWNPGWVDTPADEWPKKVSKLVEGERWVMDGNYSNTLDMRLERCDTAIFVDRSRFTCLWRVLKRRLIFHGRTRPDLPAGCPEQMDWEFLCWVWKYPTRVRPITLTKLRERSEGKRVVFLRSDQEIARFIAEL